jgi:hypothetical protein
MGLLKGFEKLGYDITILQPEIDKDVYYYDRSNDLSRYDIIRIKNDNLGQKIANMQGSSSRIQTFVFKKLRALYNQLSLFDRSKQYLSEAVNFPKYNEYYDIVISTSDPKTSHIFVSKLISLGLKYGKWIQHWGDPLLGDVSRRNVYPSWYIKRIEKKIISGADRVVYVSPFTAEIQRSNHSEFINKICFAPLMSDDDTVNERTIKLPLDNLRIAYIGDYNSQTRNIMPLYNACKKLDFVFLNIAGNSDLILESTDRIKVNPRVPQTKAKEMESKADVIVSVGNRFGTQIPGKIYYLSSSDKVILITMEEDKKQEMTEYFESFSRYVLCDNSEDAIKQALENIRKKSVFRLKTPEKLLPVNIVKSIINSL